MRKLHKRSAKNSEILEGRLAVPLIKPAENKAQYRHWSWAVSGPWDAVWCPLVKDDDDKGKRYRG